MDYGDFRDLFSRTASDKVVSEEAFNIAKYQKSYREQRGLASLIYKFFDKNFSDSGAESKIITKPNISRSITQTNYYKT